MVEWLRYPNKKGAPGRKGQGWVMDYAVSLLIFALAITLSVKILVNTLTPDDFEKVKAETLSLSSQLLGEGSPRYWNPGEVVIPGLTLNGRINEAKLKNFLAIPYADSKSLLGLSHDYAFYFQDRNGSLLSVGSECVLGSDQVVENKTLKKKLLSSAYYYKDQSLMAGYMAKLVADFYYGNDEGQDSDFYNALQGYDFLFLENPSLDEKYKQALNSFLRKGGVIFITGNASINLSGVYFNKTNSTTATVTLTEGNLGVTLNDTIQRRTTGEAFTVENINATNFTVLATYDDSKPFIAKWMNGLGTAYYFSTLNANYTGAATLDLTVKAFNGAETYVNVTVAECHSFNLTTKVEDLARIDRVTVRGNDLVRMVVMAWR